MWYSNINFLMDMNERKSVSAITQDMSSVPTFFFFSTHTLHYTSSQVVEYCSLNKASIYPFFSYTQEFLRKWSQIMIRKPSYFNHVAGLHLFCFLFQSILCLKNLITSKSIIKN